MSSMEIFAPQLIPALAKHAELTNLPRIGIKENVAYPTMQLNIAPAVSYNKCHGMWLFDQIINFMLIS